MREVTRDLADYRLSGDRSGMIDELRALEELANAAHARQARLAAAFDTAEREAQKAAGEIPAHLGRGVPEQIALARRESPYHARIQLGLAKVTHELPNAMAAFRAGLVSEYRMTQLAKETQLLTLEDRLAIDEELAADTQAFTAMSDQDAINTAKRMAIQADPAAEVERRKRAKSERYVGLRPAPEAMSYLTALLPLAQGVAAYASLRAEAERHRKAEDPRSRGQVMADTLVTRLTGTTTTEDGQPVVPVTVGLIMPDTSLLPDTTPSNDGPNPGDKPTPSNDGPAPGSEPTPNGSPAADGGSVADGSPVTDGASARGNSADSGPVTDGSPVTDGAGARADGSPVADGASARSDSAADSGPVADGGPAADGSPVTDGLAGRSDSEATAHGAGGAGSAPDEASIAGWGPIPAALARALVLGALDNNLKVFIKRLYRHPETGELVAMESSQRLFPKQMAQFLRYRDQYCRMPWCNAPIRHADHITPAAEGGPTTIENGQGLCESCNHAKQARGWTMKTTGGPGHTVQINTPTGHDYQSQAPPQPGHERNHHRPRRH
jgi:hypothetical protein